MRETRLNYLYVNFSFELGSDCIELTKYNRNFVAKQFTKTCPCLIVLMNLLAADRLVGRLAGWSGWLVG